jgi:hypothetical protein
MRIVLWPKLIEMIKDFNELRSIDKLPTKKLGDYPYLPWLDCLFLLRDNGADDVQYDCAEILWAESFGKKQALVKVYVEIDGKRRSITHPVALGEFSTDEPTCRQIEWAIQRAFVKCVAINWGLGIDLWPSDVDAAPAPSDNKIGMRITMAFDAKRQELGLSSADDLHEKLGTDKKFLDNLISKGSKEDQLAFIEKLGAVAKEELF